MIGWSKAGSSKCSAKSIIQQLRSQDELWEIEQVACFGSAGGESFGFAVTHAVEDAETGSPGQTHQNFALHHFLKLACMVKRCLGQSTDHRFIDHENWHFCAIWVLQSVQLVQPCPDELKLMVLGVISGMRVLAWAMVLLVLGLKLWDFTDPGFHVADFVLTKVEQPAACSPTWGFADLCSSNCYNKHFGPGFWCLLWFRIHLMVFSVQDKLRRRELELIPVRR